MKFPAAIGIRTSISDSILEPIMSANASPMNDVVAVSMFIRSAFFLENPPYTRTP